MRRFVDCDSNQPCVELRVSLELVDLFVRLEERILHDIFSVFTVLRDMLRNPEDLPVVLADQRIVGRNIAAAHPVDQGYVGMRFEFSCNRLDGRHESWLRKFVWGRFTAVATGPKE